MTREDLQEQIIAKKSMLCVGLDTDLSKIPKHLLETEDPIFEFNKAIIDATAPYTVSYKPNIAFYEAYGVAGWNSLIKTINYLNTEYPKIFTIADAKRGDIGNTSNRYAKAFLDWQDFDSVTVAPYMGSDSVLPFLTVQGKWVILLALTSNEGSVDFQTQELKNGKMLFEEVLEKSKDWGNADNMMYVVGATKADYLKRVRQIVPDNFLLIPGVGAQGGSLREVMENGLSSKPNLLINSSRGIIYSGGDSLDFAKIAGESAQTLQGQMAQYL